MGARSASPPDRLGELSLRPLRGFTPGDTREEIVLRASNTMWRSTDESPDSFREGVPCFFDPPANA